MTKIVTVRAHTSCVTCSDDIWPMERAYEADGGLRCMVCQLRRAAPDFAAALERRLGEDGSAAPNVRASGGPVSSGRAVVLDEDAVYWPLCPAPLGEEENGSAPK